MNLIAYDGQIELEEDDWADEWGCEFDDDCLMPSYDHKRSECYNIEMALAWQEEQEKIAG